MYKVKRFINTYNSPDLEEEVNTFIERNVREIKDISWFNIDDQVCCMLTYEEQIPFKGTEERAARTEGTLNYFYDDCMN